MPQCHMDRALGIRRPRKLVKRSAATAPTAAKRHTSKVGVFVAPFQLRCFASTCNYFPAHMLCLKLRCFASTCNYFPAPMLCIKSVAHF